MRRMKNVGTSSVGAVALDDLDIVKLSGHLYGKRNIESLGIKNMVLITATILAVLVIVIQIFVPLYLTQ